MTLFFCYLVWGLSFAAHCFVTYAYRSANKATTKELDRYRRANNELSTLVVTQDDMSNWDRLSPTGREIWRRLYKRRDRRNGND